MAGPVPEGFGIASRRGKRIEIERAGVMAEAVLDEVGYFLLDGAGGKGGKGRRGWIALSPAMAVIGVEVEAAADGIFAGHEHVVAGASGAVEPFEQVGRAFGMALGENVGRGDPAFVWDLDEAAGLEERREVVAKLVFGGAHDANGAGGREQGGEGVAIGTVDDEVKHVDAARGLFQGELAHVRDDERELLAMVGTACRFPRVFDEDDADLGGVFAAERADGIGELVVGDEEPEAAFLAAGEAVVERLSEERHDCWMRRGERSRYEWDVRVRLDKWLWAARFFKTRSLAGRACELGRIQCNGQDVKAAREVHVGDVLRVKNEGGEFEVKVLALSEMRGPAAVAQTLYFETEASREARVRAAEARKADPFYEVLREGRPSKRDRRELNRMRGRG